MVNSTRQMANYKCYILIGALPLKCIASPCPTDIGNHGKPLNRLLRGSLLKSYTSNQANYRSTQPCIPRGREIKYEL